MAGKKKLMEAVLKKLALKRKGKASAKKENVMKKLVAGEKAKKKLGGKERAITGVGSKAVPGKGHKLGKMAAARQDDAFHKGLGRGVNMAQAKAQAARKGAAWAKKAGPAAQLQREFEGLTAGARRSELAKGMKSKYWTVIQKIFPRKNKAGAMYAATAAAMTKKK